MEFAISRKTGYKIFDRYKESGLEALTDRSRRPWRYGNQLAQRVETAIDWVDDIEKATTDYSPAIETTREALKVQHGIETEAVEVGFPELPQVGSK